MLVLCLVTTNIILDIRKRDELNMPLKKNENGHPGEKLLVEAVEIFKAWKSSGNIGLTSETFTACIHTIGAIVELAHYLIDDSTIEYVLTGKLMSDPLEGRFGWYRQTNGGNFFMSVKQLLFAEKKIRCLALLQKNALSAARTISMCDNNKCEKLSQESYQWVVDIISPISLEDIPESDAAVSYYVSGYIALQISNRKKRIACKDLLLASCDQLHIADFVAQEDKKLFDIADRGGFSKPSEFCYVVTSLAVVYFSTVASDELQPKRLLCAQNSRSVFCAAATRAVSNSPS